MLKLKKKIPVVFEFLRPQENVTPDRILARIKAPIPYGRGIKSKCFDFGAKKRTTLWNDSTSNVCKPVDTLVS